MQRFEQAAGVYPEQMAGHQLPPGNRRTLDFEPVLIGLQNQIVANTNAGQHDAEFLSDLAAQMRDTLQQIAAALRVHQGHQAVGGSVACQKDERTIWLSAAGARLFR